MSAIIETLDDIAGEYDAVLCDLWGCYHDGLRPYPAAMDALRRYRARGGTVILLTNAPRPAQSVARFLAGIGADAATWDAIVSSGEACQKALSSGAHGVRIHYVGPGRDLHMLEEAGLAPAPLDEAEAILCTGLRDDSRETPADYAGEIAAWGARGLTMLCANPDIVVDRGAERLWCAGALARDYEAAGGPVVWFGKPHLPVYARCREVLAEMGRPLPDGRILAIGDGIGTDVAGAARAGLDCVFVSGGLAAEELGGDPERPDPGLLGPWLTRHGAAPRFTIGRLR